MEVRECPQCGAPVTNSSERQCAYCKAEFFVDSLATLRRFDPNEVNKYLKSYATLVNQDPHDPEGLLGLGLCYLQMDMYPLAQKQFEQIIETSPEVMPAYYYYVLASIKGRRLMTLRLSEVRQFETYLQPVVLFDSEISNYSRILLAMIKRDYYAVNGMKVPPPSAEELLSYLHGKEIDENEVRKLTQSVKVASPEDYFNGLFIV